MALALGDILESGLLRRAGIAASVLVHLLFLGWLVFAAQVHPFAARPPQTITVELVPPQEAPPDFSPPDIRFTDTPQQSTAEQAPAAEAAAPTPADKQRQAAEPVPPPPPSPPANAVSQPPPPTQAAPPQSAAASSDAPPDQSPMAATFGAPITAADLADQFGSFFQNAGPGYDGGPDAARLKSEVVTAFRVHLKTCSKLPAGIPPDDKVRVVLRVALNRDGTLAAPPALIQAKVSPSGPALRQAAVKALQSCQPYSMLPADKYDEWRLLDLDFAPGDFTPG